MERITKDNIYILWPDNFMCELSELALFQHRSDDYKIIEVLEYAEDGEPSRYIDYKEEKYGINTKS